MQQHLKDCLFHAVSKHIRDSIRYLYSNPRTTYSQLIIAAHKAESKNEEVCDKVRARSAMTTEPVEGSPELGNQIAKLMAVLTRAGQGNSPASAPNSPRQRGSGRGWMYRSTLGHASSHNGQTGLEQTTSGCWASARCGTGTTTTGGQGPNTQGSKEGTSNRQDPSCLQCFRCQGWGHMAWKCATPAKNLNPSMGTEGMSPNPLPAPAATANNRPKAFPP